MAGRWASATVDANRSGRTLSANGTTERIAATSPAAARGGTLRPTRHWDSPSGQEARPQGVRTLGHAFGAAMSDEDAIRAKSLDLSPVDVQLQSRILRLLPLHGVGPHEPRRPPPVLAADRNPSCQRILLRVGSGDYRAVTAAVDSGRLNAAAILTALTERRGVIRAAGDTARAAGIPFGTDPMFFRCAMDGFRTPQSFRHLSYAPPEGTGPWRSLSAEHWRRLARAVVEEQVHRQSGVLVSATIAVAHAADPALDIAVELLAASLGARSAWGPVPLIAPIFADLRGFLDLPSQRELVRRFSGASPEAFLLNLDGAHAGARPERIAGALRLMLLLQESAAPVYAGRSGPMRRLLSAYEVAGVECGIGRLDRFQLTDFAGSGGPGSQPAKVEIASLLTSLPPTLARTALQSGVLPEDDEVTDTVANNAAVLAAEARADEQRTPAERRDALRSDLVQGRHFAEQLMERGVDVRSYTAPLRTWLKAMELADAWGLHDVARLRAQLRDAA